MQERKEKLVRVLQILQDTDEKSPVNANQIIQKLNDDYQVGEIDRRSIYRDVAMLIHCGYPIEKCSKGRDGWYYKDHVFSDWELKIMIDAISQTRFITAENAAKIRKKMMRLVSERSRFNFASIIDVSTDSGNKDDEAGKTLATILEALYTKKKISFQYTELDAKLNTVLRREGHRYLLNLYTLYWADNTYYLLGSHDGHTDHLVHYRLDRIRNLEITKEQVAQEKEILGDNPELYLKNYVSRSVRHFSGDTIKIIIEYVPDQTINGILFDFVGKDVFIKTIGDGKVQAQFRMADSPTLIDWLIQYANRIKVVEPVELKEKVIEKLKNSLDLYMEK